MTTDVAFVVFHESVTALPGASDAGGLALKERMRTWPIVTVTLPRTWPFALLAVKVWVVVLVGLTVTQSFACRPLPTPGSILMLVAPFTCQHSLVEPVVSRLEGVAVNTTTCGTEP